jgi:O-antigen/teichoic acid export membrane protein
MSSIRLNTLFVSIGQGLRIAMAMLLLPVASRVLGPASFGRFNLATTIMFFIMLADDLGLSMWVTREIAKHKDRAQRYFAYTVGLKIVLIPLSLLFVVVYLKLGEYDPETMSAIWIFAVYAVICSFRDLSIALFRAFEEMQWESLALSVEKVLTTALGIVVLLMGGGLRGLAWAFVASAAASLIFSVWPLFRTYVRPAMAFSMAEFIPMLRGAVVFGISIFLTTIYSRIDMVMLSLLKGPDYWGWYSAAHKLIDFTNVVPTVLMIATFPALARASGVFAGDLNRLFTRGFKWLLLLAIPMVPGVVLLSKPVILGFYGGAYAPSIPALQVLGCTAAVLFLNIYTAGVFGATNNQGKLVIIQMFGLALSATLNYLLIPHYAHVGSSIASLITESVVLTATLILAFSRIVRLTEWRFIRDAFIAAAVMSAAIYGVRSWPVGVVAGTGAAVYFAVLFALKTVTWQEIWQFKKPNRGQDENSIL